MKRLVHDLTTPHTLTVCPSLGSMSGKASTWEIDGPAQMHIRLVRHVSISGRIRVLTTSLDQSMASVAELAHCTERMLHYR